MVFAGSAHSATAAAEVQQRTGRLPAFSRRPRKTAGARERKAREKAAMEAAAALISSPALPVEPLKNSLSSKHGIAFLRNSEILRFIPASEKALRARLLKSPTRTLSGVSPVAIMPPPAACGGFCTYCPKGENAPQSYTGYEPTTMRAIQNGYSASRQVRARLRQYAGQGHEAEKCHLIIMGGTFLNVPKKRREAFMKSAFDALNGSRSPSLAAAIAANENAPHKAIGVTFETRPDFGFAPHADEMLEMGGTQVELGVQCLSDSVYAKVRRGHTVEDVARSTGALRDSGFKLCYHMMPGLLCTPKQDVAYFRELFSDACFRPDMLKIYPALVIRGTGLYGLWKKGEYSPYSTEEAAEVIADATKFIPPYVRIPRIQRDIPTPLISAGVKNSNLRQIVERLLSERGEKCRCIRCREVGSADRRKSEAGKLRLSLERIDYSASGGKEVFLSFEDTTKDLLAGFLRLRMPGESHREEIFKGGRAISSLVRELHVYGQEAAVGERDEGKFQHKGLGRALLSEAERITKEEFGLEKISVLSGPGARGYYRKFGYALDGPYMARKA